MRCLVTYQLQREENPFIFDFTDESPDMEKVVLRVSEFLHPEVAYEFLPSEKDGKETIYLLRERIADARAFLQQYCGLQKLCYRVISEEFAPASSKVSSPAVEAVAADAVIVL